MHLCINCFPTFREDIVVLPSSIDMSENKGMSILERRSLCRPETSGITQRRGVASQKKGSLGFCSKQCDQNTDFGGLRIQQEYPAISHNTWVSIQHFIQLTHTTLKNVKLLKHFKISKNAPTCFGLRGNHHQGATISTKLKNTLG